MLVRIEGRGYSRAWRPTKLLRSGPTHVGWSGSQGRVPTGPTYEGRSELGRATVVAPHAHATTGTFSRHTPAESGSMVLVVLSLGHMLPRAGRRGTFWDHSYAHFMHTRLGSAPGGPCSGGPNRRRSCWLFVAGYHGGTHGRLTRGCLGGPRATAYT